MIRPLYSTGAPVSDFLALTADSSGFSINQNVLYTKGKVSISLLPLTLKQQYNSHHPFGWNDGAMIPAKGYQSLLSAGVYTKVGPLSIQLQPELVFAQNSAFTTFPTSLDDDIWKSYYYVLNRIDAPERLAEGVYSKLLPGQSSVRFNYKKLSLGVSTENLWWGPGVRNSLVMSNTAPGFAHFTFNTTAPVKTKIGSFEWQVVGGFLEGSNILPPDTARTFQGQKLYNPKPDGDRYLNGMVVTWNPKWTKGLHLGVSRAFYQYSHNVTSDLNGYLPVVSALFKSNAKKEDEFGRDQLISLFARMVLPESRAEFYFEYGRNDHAQNIRDFILEPEHARAYLIGVKKLFPTATGREVELFGEITHLQSPSTQSVRPLEGWYTHYQVRHGYTHEGQMLGAGIGPGGSSQTIGLNWLRGANKFGGVIERIVHNNDFYYDAFANQKEYERHWVDLAFSLNKSWMKKRLIYSANLGLVRSFNYKWQYNTISDEEVNATNVHAAFSVSFL
ncbi:capsule assembly Wzi family protein [Pontibacter sp. BT327]|uniref:Capsule assembly Wzi family protein n=1 Tax=Pontibacter burrus TaxID=2704466 RepID=A0A6B3LQM3_9BACT|nr:capsule assembly Wzi family protein [Pontibacter burrus]